MKNKKTIIFLIITFLWSWIFWIIGLFYLKRGISQETINSFLILFFLGVYGPSISAIITTSIYSGFKGVLDLLKKILIWKLPLKNYLFVIFAPLFFVSIGIILYSLFVGNIGYFEPLAFFSIPTILWAGLYAGPLGEELGWRGFLLPELQKKFSNLKSAIYIGIIWFTWHIPLFWAPFGTLVSGDTFSFLPIVIYFIMLICLSIMITWLVINSKESVLIAILFHLSINAGIALLFFPELNLTFKIVHLLSSIPMIIFIVILIVKNNLKFIPKN